MSSGDNTERQDHVDFDPEERVDVRVEAKVCDAVGPGEHDGTVRGAQITRSN